MQRDTLKKYYIVHSWVGVITGILMFVIAFSGAVSVFGSPELKLWTNPVLHRDIVIDPATIDELTKRYGAEIGDEYKHEVLVLMPGASAYGDFRLLFMTEHGENERMELLNFDPQTLELKQRIEGTREEVDAQQTLDMESFITLPPMHPCSGQYSLGDMRLHLSNTITNTEGGKKVTQALGNTGRAVAGSISNAKGVFSSWMSSLKSNSRLTRVLIFKFSLEILALNLVTPESSVSG